jgi:Fe-S oxidoreductase
VRDIGRLAPHHILTGSSRVLRALRQPLPAGLAGLPPVEHLTEFLGARLGAPDASAVDRKPDPGPVAYHDPCSLGRRARVFDAPRDVIERVTGAPPLEFPHARALAECCGEGGLLPDIDPQLAARLAAAQVDRMPEGAKTLVTACPGCRAQLGGATGSAGGPTVIDISELVADRFGLI